MKDDLYLQSIEEETRFGARTLAGLAVVLFPVFTVLDYLQGEKYVVLSLIRFSTTFFFLCAWLLLRKGIGDRRPFLTVNILLFVASLSITLMCMVLQGPSSPYYAGVNLVVLASVLILTVSPVDMAKLVAMIIGIYIIGVLSVTGSFQEHLSAFINNLFFLFSTAVIGVTASHFKFKMRRKAFYQNLEIVRSIEVLKNDLESKNVDAGIVGLAQEMVEKKGEVQNALQIRDGFISMASHELRTPLTSMKLQMDLVKMKLTSSKFSQEEVLKHHLNAYRQINSIVHLVDEMLDVSRIQSGKFVIEKEHVDLNDLVKGVVERNYSTHSERIVLHLESAPLKGHWDPFKIEQVIVNLINNALRYGGEGKVLITTEKRGTSACLIVSDKGPGITEADLQKIFDKFERGKGSKSGGLGLGLFISKEIAENHGGSLTVQSKEGEGSSFTLQLPL